MVEIDHKLPGRCILQIVMHKVHTKMTLLKKDISLLEMGLIICLYVGVKISVSS